MWRAAKSVIREPPGASAVAGSPSVTGYGPGVAPVARRARSRDACPGWFVCLRGSGDVAPSAPAAYAQDLSRPVSSAEEILPAAPEGGRILRPVALTWPAGSLITPEAMQLLHPAPAAVRTSFRLSLPGPRSRVYW